MESAVVGKWCKGQALECLGPRGAHQEKSVGEFLLSGVENDALAGSTLQLVDGQSIAQDDGKHGPGAVNPVGMPLSAYRHDRH